MRKLLVTGGAGFIGANFVYYWLEKYPDDQVVVLDSLTYAGNQETLKDAFLSARCSLEEGNICDSGLVESIIRRNKIDTVVNFAAESHVDRSISSPDVFIETNIIGTYSLLKVAKKLWLDEKIVESHRFHHVSTDEVYGTLSPLDPPFQETTAYDPRSPYSASKAASDHLVSAYHHTYGLDTTISNCSNNYGPYHYPEKLIPLIITNILYDKPLPIYGDGQQIRDWLYVTDHARGIDLVLNCGKSGENYNIGGHNEWANIDIVNEVCRLMDKFFKDDPMLFERFPLALSASAGCSESLITYVTDRAGHDRRYAIDAGKTNLELNYQPTESFETGILKTIQWYLNNEAWWLRLVNPVEG